MTVPQMTATSSVFLEDGTVQPQDTGLLKPKSSQSMIPQTGRVIGVSGLSAASPVEMATRNGPVLVAMHALPQNPGPVTVQTAQELKILSGQRPLK